MNGLDLLNYAAPFLSTALLVIALRKDWKAHHFPWRIGAIVIILAQLSIGIFAAYRTGTKQESATKQHDADQARIEHLQTTVETGNNDHEREVNRLSSNLNEMHQKLADIQTEVKTADLRKEVSDLQGQLESTRKALDPPKADLHATFGLVTRDMENIDVKEMRVPLKPDGTIHIPLQVVNAATAQGKNGSIFIKICGGCEYTQEPANFHRIPGSSEAEREWQFSVILARVGVNVPLDIRPPSGVHQIQIDVGERCENVRPARPPFFREGEPNRMLRG